MDYTFSGALALLREIGIKEETVQYFAERIARLESDDELNSAMRAVVERYQTDLSADIRAMLPVLDELAGRMGESNFTVYFMFLLANTHRLYSQYNSLGIPREIYLRSMDDLRCKLAECIECKGVPGTFVAGWFNGFFRVDRFGLGRFQFEKRQTGIKDKWTASCGLELAATDAAINIHIPSSGIPLTDEVRMDSYRRAYEFYRPVFGDKPAVFKCSSWLLFPRHAEFLPADSNILRFASDFELVSSEESENFGDAWRVFGHWAELPPQEWPRDTGLRRAYAEWVCAGNKTGEGFGIMLFDGSKILR